MCCAPQGSRLVPQAHLIPAALLIPAAVGELVRLQAKGYGLVVNH